MVSWKSGHFFVLAAGVTGVAPRLGFKIPRNGTSISGRLEPEIELWVEDHVSFVREYGEVARLCCEVDNVSLGCERLESTQIRPGPLELGDHVMTCVLVNLEDGRELIGPASSHFKSVASAAETEDGKRLLDLKQKQDIENRELLAWWQGTLPEMPKHFETLRQRRQNPEPSLVVGVKCAAANVVARDAMRRTWISAAPSSIAVLFAIGSSASFSEMLSREHETFRDLLLKDELEGVEDAYNALVPKTKAMLAYFVRHFDDRVPFVALVDDDVYVDAKRLAESLPLLPTKRFYGGQVWAEHFGQPKLPQRDPKHRNYLSEEDYPMSQLPPFAIGPHYILSRDCAKFIADNKDILRGVGTLEDVSVALWMLAIGVKPQHTPLFANARLFGCLPHAVSLADLTPAGIKHIHDNRLNDRDPCYGYDELEWVKNPRFKFASS